MLNSFFGIAIKKAMMKDVDGPDGSQPITVRYQLTEIYLRLIPFVSFMVGNFVSVVQSK